MTIYVSQFETAVRGNEEVSVKTRFYGNGDCYSLEAFLKDQKVTIEDKTAGSALNFVVSKSEIPALSDAFKARGLQMIGGRKAA